MHEQSTMTFRVPVKDRLEIAFDKFHRQNPGVAARLTRMALDLRRAGRQTYGMAGLFEVLRWQTAIETVGSQWKLNNNYRSFYSRLIEGMVPELEGFFTRRQSVADRRT